MQVSLKVWGGQSWSLYNPFLVYCLRNINLYHDLHNSKSSNCFCRTHLHAAQMPLTLALQGLWESLNKCWYICCLLFQSLEVIFLYHIHLYVCVCTWKDVCCVFCAHVCFFICTWCGHMKNRGPSECCFSATIDLTVLLPRNLAIRVGWLSSKIQRSS